MFYQLISRSFSIRGEAVSEQFRHPCESEDPVFSLVGSPKFASGGAAALKA
jgi:hypothetical protein